jgi:hypothetical protein
MDKLPSEIINNIFSYIQNSNIYERDSIDEIRKLSIDRNNKEYYEKLKNYGVKDNGKKLMWCYLTRQIINLKIKTYQLDKEDRNDGPLRDIKNLNYKNERNEYLLKRNILTEYIKQSKYQNKENKRKKRVGTKKAFIQSQKDYIERKKKEIEKKKEVKPIINKVMKPKKKLKFILANDIERKEEEIEKKEIVEPIINNDDIEKKETDEIEKKEIVEPIINNDDIEKKETDEIEKKELLEFKEIRIKGNEEYIKFINKRVDDLNKEIDKLNNENLKINNGDFDNLFMEKIKIIKENEEKIVIDKSEVIKEKRNRTNYAKEYLINGELLTATIHKIKIEVEVTIEDKKVMFKDTDTEITYKSLNEVINSYQFKTSTGKPVSYNGWKIFKRYNNNSIEKLD